MKRHKLEVGARCFPLLARNLRPYPTHSQRKPFPRCGTYWLMMNICCIAIRSLQVNKVQFITLLQTNAFSITFFSKGQFTYTFFTKRVLILSDECCSVFCRCRLMAAAWVGQPCRASVQIDAILIDCIAQCSVTNLIENCHCAPSERPWLRSTRRLSNGLN